MRLSVVIPAYNAAATLPVTLRSISAPAGHELEVIVVDDASSDATADLARPLCDRLLVLPGNSGPSVARNEGARLATGEVLVFTDADVELKPDTLERVVARLEQHPECAAVVGNLAVESTSENFIGTYKNLYMHFAFMASGPYVSVPYTSIAAVRSAAFWQAGGFANVLPNEDRVLGIELARNGHKILFDNQIQVIHHRSYWWREFLRVETARCRNIVVLHLETKLLGRGTMREHIPRSFAVACLALPLVALLPLLGETLSPLFLWALPAPVIAFLWSLRSFYVFLWRHKGLRFALAGVAFSVVDLAIAGFGVVRGFAAFLLGRRLLAP